MTKEPYKFKIFPWDEENAKPYFTNSEGFEWWADDSSTKWAHEDVPLSGAKGAKNLVVFIVRKAGKARPETRIVMDKNTNEVVYENQALEAIACWLDMYKVAHTIPNDKNGD